MSSIIPCYCDECTHLDEDENSVACGACVHIGAGSEDNYVCSADHVLELDAKIASAIAAERERCAGICKGIAEEYGRLSAGQSARVDALRHGLSAIANKARSPAEIIASRVLAADDACTEINQSVGYAVARECERRIRGEK